MRDRLLELIRKLIRSEFPNYSYMGVYEYAIQSAQKMVVDADPTDTTIGLPSIMKLPLKSSILGEEVEPIVGKLIYIMFANGRRTKPIVISCEPSNKTIEFDALSIKIGGTGPPAARLGDTILAAGIFAGAITSGSTKTTVG